MKTIQCKGNTICDENGVICKRPHAMPALQWQANAAHIIKCVNAHDRLLEALQMAQKLIKVARQHFPKSLKNHDTFALELTCAEIGKALHQAES